MEMGEGIGVGLANLKSQKDPECNKEDKDPGWKSRVNKWNSQEECTGTRLYDNMEAEADAHEKKGLGVVPSKTAGTQWSLATVTARSFPVQAHHLIPKNYLPDHKVCTWLALKYTKNDDYQLRYDSGYDTDNPDNGYCMPYATPLKEWGGTKAEKAATAFKVMDIVGVQLHQGSHAQVLDAAKLEEMAGKPIVPDFDEAAGSSDGMEEAKIHEPGYLNRVGLLLNMVQLKGQKHADDCQVCMEKEESGKKKVLPAAGIVSLMNRVSLIIKVLVDANEMHVSGLGYFWAYHRGQLSVKNGKIWLRGTTEEIAQKLG
jgi:hypothetical protein